MSLKSKLCSVNYLFIQSSSEVRESNICTGRKQSEWGGAGAPGHQRHGGGGGGQRLRGGQHQQRHFCHGDRLNTVRDENNCDGAFSHIVYRYIEWLKPIMSPPVKSVNQNTMHYTSNEFKCLYRYLAINSQLVMTPLIRDPVQTSDALSFSDFITIKCCESGLEAGGMSSTMTPPRHTQVSIINMVIKVWKYVFLHAWKVEFPPEFHKDFMKISSLKVRGWAVAFIILVSVPIPLELIEI